MSDKQVGAYVYWQPVTGSIVNNTWLPYGIPYCPPIAPHSGPPPKPTSQ